METQFGGKLHNFYGPVVSDLGKKSLEWDLNDWRWDGDLFLAAPLNSVPSECKSRQLFPIESSNGAAASICCYPPYPEKLMPNPEQENRNSEKKRRAFDLENEEAGGSLNLKLGGQVHPSMEGEVRGDGPQFQGQIGKKSEVSGPQSSRAICQVEDCKVDLSNAKDYHRRHKVCDMHSKAPRALVGDVVQRFCQQCSRFHGLEEFDEGKRSCRRRLAGHNKRRRKTQIENVINAAPENDEQRSNYLLISLLRILSNIHSNGFDQSKDQNLLSHIFSNLASLAGPTNGSNNTGFPLFQGLPNMATPLDPSPEGLGVPVGPVASTSASDLKRKGVSNEASVSQPASHFPVNAGNSTRERASDAAARRTKLNNIDLNAAACDVSHSENIVNGPCSGPLWLCKDSVRSSPPRISGNSGSTFSQSPSTSSGDTQNRTDRIVFKLFGKDPSDFPLDLRKQILDWLSNSPTDIESYIRPGCIILTMYLRLDKSSWDELCCDLASSLMRLADPFWKTGWIYTRMQDRVAFLYNGQLVLDTPLPVKPHGNYRISSIKPIAVTASETVHFSVRGFCLSDSASRLLCIFEGNYLIQENFADTTRRADFFEEHDGTQSFSFSCVIPDIIGRGFIEVEDHCLNSSFFPFIVAEKDVCSEIRSLESIFEGDDSEESEARNQALEFMHEMGWLLHRNRLNYRLLGQNIHSCDLKSFSFERFRWLIEFSIDRDWPAVARKLLNILFDSTLDSGREDSNKVKRLLEIGLLHRAVRSKCRPVVEFLLSYRPSRGFDETGHQYLFRPDAAGPGGLTPLHVAACLDGCEGVVDALTEDPGHVGIEAWKTTRDSGGLTPHDYARLRGHNSINDLVERKLNKKSEKGHAIIDIFDIESVKTQKIEKASKFDAAFECRDKMATMMGWPDKECGPCRAKRLLASHSQPSVRSYRPVIVSMVAIAAVCVCTALIFKTLPRVLYVICPFRWEQLKFGAE